MSNVNTFENFVEYVSTQDIENCDPHLRLQSKLIDLNNIDYLGHFENLESDTATIFKNRGLAIADLPVVNASTARRPYRDYFDSALAGRVAEIYRKDIQLFNYRF